MRQQNEQQISPTPLLQPIATKIVKLLREKNICFVAYQKQRTCTRLHMCFRARSGECGSLTPILYLLHSAGRIVGQVVAETKRWGGSSLTSFVFLEYLALFWWFLLLSSPSSWEARLIMKWPALFRNFSPKVCLIKPMNAIVVPCA